MSDVMIPPWVLPESPETIRWIDDATQSFPPAFGRGMTQRSSMADPRWGLKRRYRGLRSDQKAAILQCLNESRGQFNKILVTSHAPLRGSFATSEILSNGTFANGTTGWAAYSGVSSLTVADRVLRDMLTQNNGTTVAAFVNSSAITTLTQYAPYVVRAMILGGKGFATGSQILVGSTSGASDIASQQFTSQGLVSVAFVPNSGGSFFILIAGGTSASGRLAGDYFSCSYVSISRCALADLGPNSLLYSSDLTNAAWSPLGLLSTAYGTTGAFGTATASTIVENSSNSVHNKSQQIARTSAIADWQAHAIVSRGSGTRNVRLLIDDGAGSSGQVDVDLSNGSVLGSAIAGFASNLRVAVQSLGGGFYYIGLVVNLTASSSAIRLFVYLLSGSTSVYTGNGTSSLIVECANVNLSSCFTRPVTTTSAATAGSAPSGGAMYVKGLPASTDGLLLPNDWMETANQLKQATAPLNSDAAGLGYLQFRPSLGDSPADDDPVIINQPFGRFIYSGQQKELENQFGIYGDIEMDLEEVYS